MEKLYLFNVSTVCILSTWGPHTVCHGDPIYILYLYDIMWLVGMSWDVLIRSLFKIAERVYATRTFENRKNTTNLFIFRINTLTRRNIRIRLLFTRHVDLALTLRVKLPRQRALAAAMSRQLKVNNSWLASTVGTDDKTLNSKLKLWQQRTTMWTPVRNKGAW